MSKRWSTITAAAAAIAGLAGAAYYLILKRPLARTKGTIRLEGLNGEVEILRDRWGVPHIYAAGEHDLLFAQGFTHAQDRLWQLDFHRRLVAGRLSEVMGELTLPVDRWIRTLSMRRVAEQEVDSAHCRVPIPPRGLRRGHQRADRPGPAAGRVHPAPLQAGALDPDRHAGLGQVHVMGSLCQLGERAAPRPVDRAPRSRARPRAGGRPAGEQTHRCARRHRPGKGGPRSPKARRGRAPLPWTTGPRRAGQQQLGALGLAHGNRRSPPGQRHAPAHEPAQHMVRESPGVRGGHRRRKPESHRDHLPRHPGHRLGAQWLRRLGISRPALPTSRTSLSSACATARRGKRRREQGPVRIPGRMARCPGHRGGDQGQGRGDRDRGGHRHPPRPDHQLPGARFRRGRASGPPLDLAGPGHHDRGAVWL